MNMGSKQPANLDSLGFIDLRRVIETLLMPWAAESSAFLWRIEEEENRELVSPLNMIVLLTIWIDTSHA